ncbi:MAG: hypothetical protein ACKN85_08880 [Pirellula sp.]
MRRNCICLCGTQIRAPIATFKRGMPCPNCGRTIVFEEQIAPEDPHFNHSDLDRDLDFNTKELTLSDRFARIPKWILYGAVVTPLLAVLASLAPFALERLGFSGPWNKPAEIENPPRTVDSSLMDWSKIKDWNTNIDVVEGPFAGYEVAREIMKKVPASQYDALERLFQYDTMRAQIVDLRNKAKYPVHESLDLIEGRLSESVRAFLADSQTITPGYHDWRVVGIAQQANKTAMLLRYYRESETVADALDDEGLLLPLTKLVDFNNFKLYCDSIFRTKQTDRNANANLLGYIYTNFYADNNFGYLVLILSGTGTDAQIQDGFDYQLKRPLSQFCLIWTGASRLNTNEIPSGTMQLPGPLESEIRVVQTWLKNKKESSQSLNLQELRTNVESIYDQTKDPLMLDLMGRLESQSGDQQKALEYFRKAKLARFQSSESHRAFLQEAIRAQDSNLLIERLHEINNFWDVKLTGCDAEEDRKKYYKFQRYWRRSENF